MTMALELVENRQRTALSALHDVNLAARFCSHILMLYGNGAWEAGPCSEVLGTESLERLYGCRVEEVETAGGTRFHPLGGVADVSS